MLGNLRRGRTGQRVQSEYDQSPELKPGSEPESAAASPGAPPHLRAGDGPPCQPVGLKTAGLLLFPFHGALALPVQPLPLSPGPLGFVVFPGGDDAWGRGAGGGQGWGPDAPLPGLWGCSRQMLTPSDPTSRTLPTWVATAGASRHPGPAHRSKDWA